MPDLVTDPFELFKLFQSRDRELTFAPVDFRLGGRAGLPFKEDLWCLDLQVVGRVHPCHRIHYDFGRSGLAFSAKFDPKAGSSPQDQLKTSAWEELLGGPFAGRTFFADPANWDAAKQALHASGTEYVPLAFSCDLGEISIPGLVIDRHFPGGEAPWTFFVSDGRQRAVIECARAYHFAREDETEGQGTTADVEQAHSQLLSLLKSHERILQPG